VPQLSLHSPIGDLTASEEAGSVVALDWGWGRDQAATPLLRLVVERLQAYFDGEVADPGADLPLSPGGTPYRQRVWLALRRIPPGRTRTYGQIAAEVGGSARSVGQANASNPIPILIPCHRVLASAGRGGRPRLGGYSGLGGLDTKRLLLELEGAMPGDAG
jgi:methylated-DNA-[protein]-cysteine S-methyltransferase